MYAKLANLRSLPAALRRSEAPHLRIGCRATQMPLVEAISRLASAAERIHADHSPAPVPAKRKAQSGGSGRAISPRAGPNPRRPAPFYSPLA